MKKRIVSHMLPLATVFIFFSTSFLFAQTPEPNNTITLTTYYPAPFGAYDTMLLVPKKPGFIPKDPCKVGTLYVDSDGKLQYCRNKGDASGNGTWGPINQVWTQSGDNIFPADTISNPNLSVGIGTTGPSALLEVYPSFKGAAFRIRDSSTGKIAFDVENNLGVGIVGIGTAGDANASTDSELTIYRGASVGDGGPWIHLENFTTDVGAGDGAFIGIGCCGRKHDLLIEQKEDAEIAFLTSDNTTKLSIAPDGNVYINDNLGIGTTNPQAKLDIGGTAGVDGIRFPDGTVLTSAGIEPEKCFWNSKAYTPGADCCSDSFLHMVCQTNGTWVCGIVSCVPCSPQTCGLP